jgi:hypothetical protein
MPRKPSPERLAAALLRRAVVEHARTERRRRYLPLVHVGTPGRPHEVFAAGPDEALDHTLRTDVLAAMRYRAAARTDQPVLVWLTRSGPLEVQDVDAAWHAAARQAFAEATSPLLFAVVNRQGWRDLGADTARAWRRPGRPTR